MGRRRTAIYEAQRSVLPAATEPTISFQARPFMVQPQTVTSSSSQQKHLQASLHRAERYGHTLANVQPSLATPAEEASIAQRKKRRAQDRLSFPLQTSLTIGQPGDTYEQEADRTAAQVVDQIEQTESLPNSLPSKSAEKPSPLNIQPLVQTQAQGAAQPQANHLEQSIEAKRGSGTPLPQAIRQPMERSFGANFSGVTIHTDAKSDQLNRSLQAKAFTTGQDIFFRQGEYQPDTRGGKELLAHELTHVVQQNSQYGKQIAKKQAPARILQAKLEKDKLNVAGETHTESDPRRSLEQQFTKKVTESDNYWDEMNFETGGELVDNAGMRLLQVSANLVDAYKDIKSNVEYSSSDDTLLLEDYKNSQTWIENIDLQLTRMSADEFKDSSLKKGWELMRSNAERVKRQVINIASQPHQADKYAQLSKIITSAIAHHERLYNWIAGKLGEQGDGGDVDVMLAGLEGDKVTQKRSRRMHEGAKKEANTPGVWKVGEEHIKQMEQRSQYDGTGGAYNLVSKEGFNQEYYTELRKGILRRNQDLMKMYSKASTSGVDDLISIIKNLLELGIHHASADKPDSTQISSWLDTVQKIQSILQEPVKGVFDP